jgi:hypothetical protein
MDHPKTDVLSKDVRSTDDANGVIKTVHSVNEVRGTRSCHTNIKLQGCRLIRRDRLAKPSEMPLWLLGHALGWTLEAIQLGANMPDPADGIQAVAEPTTRGRTRSE